MSNEKWIFFDAGDTLIDERDVWKIRCEEQALTPEAKARGLTPALIYNEVVRSAKEFKPLYRSALQRLGLGQSAPYRAEYERLFPGCDEMLALLSARFRLGVIANQAADFPRRLDALGIARFFSTVVSSWDYPFMKPDRRLFKAAMKKAGCMPADAAMVGDRLDNDVAPAKALGMRTVWVRQGFGGMAEISGDFTKPDLIVNAIGELTGAADQLFSGCQEPEKPPICPPSL